MGNRELSKMLTAISSGSGHCAGGPNGDCVQSWARMSAPISPPPERNSGGRLPPSSRITALPPIFLAALVGAVSGDAVIFHRERPRGRLQGSAEDLARSLAILDDSIERPRHPFAIEWLMFEHQHRPVAVAQQFQGPRGPRTLEVVLQSVFTRETVKAGRRRGLCDQAQR